MGILLVVSLVFALGVAPAAWAQGRSEATAAPLRLAALTDDTRRRDRQAEPRRRGAAEAPVRRREEATERPARRREDAGGPGRQRVASADGLGATEAAEQHAPTGRRPAAPSSASLAAPGRPGWVVDAVSGCWLRQHRFQPGMEVRWSGRCPGGPASGEGTAVWRWPGPEGERVSRYNGSLREGRMEGLGVLTEASGDRYEGEWRDGMRHGRGAFISASGGRYEGGFRFGLWHGRGIAEWANGDRYEGEWRDGRSHGQGTQQWRSGNQYSGEWRDNLPHGEGEYVHVAHPPARGMWQAGCFREGTRLVAVGRPANECLPSYAERLNRQ